MCLWQAKSDEVSHVQATWEQHENSMIDAQIKMTDMQAVTEAAKKAEAEALAARAAAEATLAAQTDTLDRLRSRVAGAEAEMDGLRSQVSQFISMMMSYEPPLSRWQHMLCRTCVKHDVCLTTHVIKAVTAGLLSQNVTQQQSKTAGQNCATRPLDSLGLCYNLHACCSKSVAHLTHTSDTVICPSSIKSKRACAIACRLLQ